MMIARIWQGITLTAKAEQYLEYLNTAVLPACQAAEGHEGLFILKEIRGELTYFLLLSLWTSDQALEKFTGGNAEEVNLSPEEKSLLVAYESSARHYEVLLTEGDWQNSASLGKFIAQAKDRIARRAAEL